MINLNKDLGYRVFAQNYFTSNDDIATKLNNNDMIIGGSGTGKTGGYVIPNILLSKTSLVITDTKGLLYHKLHRQLEKKGYEVRLLDFVNPEKSHSYNPLEFIRYEEIRDKNGMTRKKFNSQDIKKIASTLIPEVKNDREPFWVDSARITVEFLISFIMEALVPAEQTLMSLPKVLALMNRKADRQKLECWVMEHPDSLSKDRYEAIAGVFEADRTWACIQQFAVEGINYFSLQEFSHIYGNRDAASPIAIDLKTIGDKKTAVFVNVSDTDRSVDRIADMFYEQALQTLCFVADHREDGRLTTGVRFILDDFAANTVIPNFDKIISVIRSRNISVSIVLQNLTQLEAMYGPAAAATILSNCDHILYLGGQDLKTAEYIGIRVNKTQHTVLNLSNEKAYLIERGKTGMSVNKIVPYADIQEMQKDTDDMMDMEEAISI